LGGGADETMIADFCPPVVRAGSSRTLSTSGTSKSAPQTVKPGRANTWRSPAGTRMFNGMKDAVDMGRQFVPLSISWPKGALIDDEMFASFKRCAELGALPMVRRTVIWSRNCRCRSTLRGGIIKWRHAYSRLTPELEGEAANRVKRAHETHKDTDNFLVTV
jgi:dihydropyrimidinase